MVSQQSNADSDKAKPFRSAYLKLTRSRKHLDELVAEIRAFNDRKPYSLPVEIDANTGEGVIFYQPTDDLPDHWPGIIGDVLFNLRSALDHAVHEMHTSNGGKDGTKTEFPICESEETFRRGEDGRRGKVGQRAWDFIESMQPFRIRQDKKVALLSALQTLNNIDKHRRLHVVGRFMANGCQLPFVQASEFTLPVYRRFDERAEIMRWKPREPGRYEMDVQANIAIDIRFEKGMCGFLHEQEVIHLLKQIGTLTEAILLELEKKL